MSIAWWFPGQGTQKVGMGKELAESSKAAREVFQRADEALGEPLSKLIFDGPAADLTLTENAQPAILTTSIACLEALKEQLPELRAPAYAAGHSLGEYSALTAAGALSFDDAVRLVRIRGRAMQRAVPPGEGGMAAILGGSLDDVSELCREATTKEHPVAPANYNAPGQIAIAGSRVALDRVAKLASARKLKLLMLDVSAPFHSQLMAPARATLEDALKSVPVHSLDFPVVSNLEARPNDESGRVTELLLHQVTAPVLWHQSVEWMAAHGVDTVLEIGPGRVLAGLARRINAGLRILGVGDRAGVQGAAAFLGFL